MGQRAVLGWLVLEGPAMGTCEAVWVARFYLDTADFFFLIPFVFLVIGLLLRYICITMLN